MNAIMQAADQLVRIFPLLFGKGFRVWTLISRLRILGILEVPECGQQVSKLGGPFVQNAVLPESKTIGQFFRVILFVKSAVLAGSGFRSVFRQR